MPKVSVLMAIYHPNPVWLEKQLISLNNQTYKNMEIIICDDCPSQPVDITVLHRFLTNFPVRTYSNKKNIGSNKTFEYLTTLAAGDYIAYCDQDDIWEPDKVKALIQALEHSDALLAYSDVSIIDEKDKTVATSIRQIRKHHAFLTGLGLTQSLLTRNFVIGCTMLIKREIASQAIPFVDSMVHDHWLALYASTKGELKFINQPLVCYRQHQSNQTGILTKVCTKDDYLQKRIIFLQSRMEELSFRFIKDFDMLQQIFTIKQWLSFRYTWWQGFNLKAAYKLCKMRDINKGTTLFELFAARLPQPIFFCLISLIRKNIL